MAELIFKIETKHKSSLKDEFIEEFKKELLSLNLILNYGNIGLIEELEDQKVNKSEIKEFYHNTFIEITKELVTNGINEERLELLFNKKYDELEEKLK